MNLKFIFDQLKWWYLIFIIVNYIDFIHNLNIIIKLPINIIIKNNYLYIIVIGSIFIAINWSPILTM